MKLKVEVMDKMQEKVMVVPREYFFNKFDYFEGFKPAMHLNDNSGYTVDMEEYEYREVSRKILDAATFLTRARCENNFNYLQVIPYICVFHSGRIFYVRRGDNSSEKRLHGKISIGMGGHLNSEDKEYLWPNRNSVISHSCTKNIIFNGALRELDEETEISGNFNITYAGMINHDCDSVNEVHLGIVFFAKLWENTKIFPRELDKISGHGLTYTHVLLDSKHEDTLEIWSKSIIDGLRKIDRNENYA
jgi:predicted NUDIX family phosphoesterase